MSFFHQNTARTSFSYLQHDYNIHSTVHHMKRGKAIVLNPPAVNMVCRMCLCVCAGDNKREYNSFAEPHYTVSVR